jgi:hypothetical protein
MNRLGIWGLEIALCVTLGTATVTAAELADDESSPPKAAPSGHGSFLNTLDRWFAPTPKPAPKKPKPTPKKKDADKTEAAPAKAPTMVDVAAVERERELQALLRRQQVCLKLMQIAAETRDEELQRKAESLDERARAVYAERTAHLPSCKNAVFESDEKILEKHLGPADSAAGRSAERAFESRPAVPAPSQARNREEMP